MAQARASTWDRLAPRYGAQERFELHAIDAALRIAAPTSGQRLVDLATGTGLLLRRLAATSADPPRTAIGVDSSAAMLARGGTLPAGWSTVGGDVRATPLDDGCADVVTCAYLLHLLSVAERAAVLADAHRLLAPGPRARLVVVTVWADERRAAGRAVAGALRLAARLRPATWAALRPLDPAPDLAAAGFEITRRAVLPRRGYPSLVLAAAAAGRAAER